MSLDLQHKLGNKTKSPKWACAFKWEAETAQTALQDITVQIGRTGKLTPVAELLEVELSGSIVKRASLHNEEEIERLGLYPGDIVLIERSGEIIPQILSRVSVSQGRFWKMPANCPCCGSKVVKKGANHFCFSTSCPEQVSQSLQHAVGKGALDWDGCGPAQIKVFVDSNAIRLSDLFAVSVEECQVILKKSACAKFLKERERVKQAPLWRKLVALGIELVGQTASKELAAKYNSLEEIVADLSNASSLLGPVATENFVDFMKQNLDEIARLDQYGFQFTQQSVPQSSQKQTLAGLVFVVTGGLLSGSRPEVSAMIEAAGGKMKGSVGKGVNYLIVGADAGAGKSEAARKLGTKCISEEELFSLMQMPMPEPKSLEIDGEKY